MPANAEAKQDYEAILGYREGARYCKMDLHAHGPASECSNYKLPEQLERLFPPLENASEWNVAYDLLATWAADQAKIPFKAAYDGATIANEQVCVGRRPTLNAAAIQRIAQVYVDEIAKLIPVGKGSLSRAQKDVRDYRVKRALGDIRRYLKSLFFPHEFVLRCYLEGMQLVALTDHNHPGYIVPRLPQLGTWFDALQAANAEYRRDILEGAPPGGKAGEAIRRRLELAAGRLAADDECRPHVEERAAFWKDGTSSLRPLYLIPGTEITVSNVHLLALFPPTWYVPGRIGAVLNTIGIPEDHWGNAFIAAASASVQDTIGAVAEAGGIAIPAHANEDHKGLLRLFESGLALYKVLAHSALIALESTGGSVLPGKSAWKTLEYFDTRMRKVLRGKSLCFVKNSDAHECRIEHKGTGEEIGQRFNHVKLDIRPKDTPGEVFDSLRLALLCGQNRVVEHPTDDSYNYAAESRIPDEDREALLTCHNERATILGLIVDGDGSYADGLRVRFSPYLNCVVGSGGKSTLVRLVGYAFGVMAFDGPATEWLPERVCVYWQEGDVVRCVERKGRHPKPEDAEVTVFIRRANGEWWPDAAYDLGNLEKVVAVWPSSGAAIPESEEELVESLTKELQFGEMDKAKPLLLRQPRDIFKSEEVFRPVLGKPRLKARQMIWSTGSPNVAAALDAEKIIVTGETKGGKRMQVECAGDLHEEEIREQYLNHFEGGRQAFARRMALYSW